MADGMDDLEERIRFMYEQNQEAATNLVFAELDIGLTFCHMTKSAAALRDKAKYERNVARAHGALALAEKYMWRLKMRHPQFDQMMAQVERLKFELDSLEKPD
jgi:hypothetical protein